MVNGAKYLPKVNAKKPVVCTLWRWSYGPGVAVELRWNCRSTAQVILRSRFACHRSITFACMSNAANDMNAMESMRPAGRLVGEGEDLITLAEAARRLPKIDRKKICAGTHVVTRLPQVGRV